jgi:hypothetical protein
MKWLVYSTAFLPIGLLILTTVISPTYITPFLHYWFGIVFLILQVAWTAIGVFYIARPETPLLARIIWAPFCILLILVPMLGPAITTIVSAIGPTMTAK